MLHQDKCAMKVGTDGVILGAWANPGGSKRVLDIGTGTGLLALMLAQKTTHAQIDAVEINREAAQQASENFKNSKWNNRLICFHTSIQEYSNVSIEKYDFIISNPPYFKLGPIAESRERAIARHNLELPLIELISCSVRLLNKSGRIALVLPNNLRRELVSVIAKQNLWIEQEVHIKPNFDKDANRILVLLSDSENSTYIKSSLIIEDGRHQYSKEFKELTADFYLREYNEFRLE